MSAPNRFFSAGTRQTPDPYDQYLEREGFYRKHTARDASCLFRVISEQMYDTQLHHLFIRESCVIYMKNNRSLFEGEIQGDYDEYIKKLGNPNTFGTILELKALAYCFERNVILFGAFNTGSCLVKRDNFYHYFRVFFTPQKHFDSIFVNDYIEVLGFTQGLMYELLYTYVFALPDVMYAVERMIYDPYEITMEYQYSKQYSDPVAIAINDGRVFELDIAEDTSCILDKYEYCHFHNKDFAVFALQLDKELKLCRNESEKNQISRVIASLLPEKYISCVRQLLRMDITPFPYKVAKGIDPFMYRNIEFDAWSEFRKSKLNVNKSNWKVGTKCLVRLCSSNSSLYNCHIQEITSECGPCLVYIEELGEKRMVSFDQLKNNKKPLQWKLSLQKKINHKKCDNNNITKLNNYNSCRKIPSDKITCVESCCYGESYDVDDKYGFPFHQLNSIRNFSIPSYEVIAMPMLKETSYKKTKNDNECDRDLNRKCNDKNNNQMNHKEDKPDRDDYQTSDSYPSSGSAYSYYNQSIPFQYDPNIPPPQVATQMALGNHGRPIYMQPGAYNTLFAQSMPPCMGSMTYSSSQSTGNPYVIPIRRKDLLISNQPINYSISPSYAPNGCDIPVQHDMASVRFFYNLGHEYFKYVHSQYGMQAIYNMTQSDTTASLSPVESIPPRVEYDNLPLELEKNLKIENEAQNTQGQSSHNKKYHRQNNQQNCNYNSNRKENKGSSNYRNNSNKHNKNSKKDTISAINNNISPTITTNAPQISPIPIAENQLTGDYPVMSRADCAVTGPPYMQMQQYSTYPTAYPSTYPTYMHYQYPADATDTYPIYQPSYFSAPYGIAPIPTIPASGGDMSAVNASDGIESPYSTYSTLYYPPSMYPSQRAATGYPTYFYLSTMPQPFMGSSAVVPTAMPGFSSSLHSASDSQ